MGVVVHAHARILADVCVGGLTTPTLAPVAVPCGWSARLPCVRPRVGSTSSPRGQVQRSSPSKYGLCGTDITASAGTGLGVTCPSAIAT